MASQPERQREDEMAVLQHQRTTLRAPGLPAIGELFRAVERAVVGEAVRGQVTVRLLALGALVSALCASIGYVLFGPGEQHQLFRDLGPVTFYVAAQTLLVGFIGLLIARRETPRGGLGVVLNFWFLAGAGFLLLSLDAPLDLHGRLGEQIANRTLVAEDMGFHRTSDAILAAYLAAGLTVAAVYHRELLRHPRVLAQFAAGSAFIAGSIVVDGFGAHGSWMWVFEETLEVFAAACFVGAFATRLAEAEESAAGRGHQGYAAEAGSSRQPRLPVTE